MTAEAHRQGRWQDRGAVPAAVARDLLSEAELLELPPAQMPRKARPTTCTDKADLVDVLAQLGGVDLRFWGEGGDETVDIKSHEFIAYQKMTVAKLHTLVADFSPEPVLQQLSELSEPEPQPEDEQQQQQQQQLVAADKTLVDDSGDDAGDDSGDDSAGIGWICGTCAESNEPPELGEPEPQPEPHPEPQLADCGNCGCGQSWQEKVQRLQEENQRLRNENAQMCTRRNTAAGQWDVARHIKGTTYHKITEPRRPKVQGWIAFWRKHSGFEIPKYCPGQINGETTKAHPMEKAVGAHALIRSADGSVKCVIIPCCYKCNNTRNEHQLVWECDAVTIMNLDQLKYAGKILLPRPKKSAAPNVAEAASNDVNVPAYKEGAYWTTISAIKSDSNGIQMSGTTNNCASAEDIKYQDPDDYLHQVALLLKSKLGGQRHAANGYFTASA